MTNWVYEECESCKRRKNLDIEICEKCEKEPPTYYEYDEHWDDETLSV